MDQVSGYMLEDEEQEEQKAESDPTAQEHEDQHTDDGHDDGELHEGPTTTDESADVSESFKEAVLASIQENLDYDAHDELRMSDEELHEMGLVRAKNESHQSMGKKTRRRRGRKHKDFGYSSEELTEAKHRDSSTRILDMAEHLEQQRLREMEKGFRYKQAPLLVLTIREDGHYEMKEMQSHEILAEARKAVPLFLGDESGMNREFVKEAKFEPTDHIMRKKSSSMKEKQKKPAYLYRFQGTLQPRDIRLFDPAFSNSHDPEILVRRHAILLNFAAAKALVLATKMFVFVSDGAADSVLGGLLLRFRELNELAHDTPFEYRAFETIFLTVCSNLEAQYKTLEPVIRSTIEEVLGSTSGVILERLRQVDSSLTQLESNVTQARHAFFEILQSDRDMALMELTRVFQSPESYVDELEDEWRIEHEEMELLLETYLQQVDGILVGIKDLEMELEYARSTTTLRLSTAQNKLLSVELLVSSVTAIGSFGTLLAAAFGMNLDSDIEELNFIFWVIFWVVICCLPVFVTLFYLYIKRRGLLIN